MNKAAIGSVIIRGKKRYQISESAIVKGDRIWCENSHSLDYCIEVFPDNSAVIEFDDQCTSKGMRGVFSLSHFQKAIQI